jgi:hypothetical protein
MAKKRFSKMSLEELREHMDAQRTRREAAAQKAMKPKKVLTDEEKSARALERFQRRNAGRLVQASDAPASTSKPITAERIERCLAAVAYVIATYGETEYLPLMERLEKELERHREGRDPLSRARAILMRLGTPRNLHVID